MIMSSMNGKRVILTDFSQARQKGNNDPISSVYTEFLGNHLIKAADINFHNYDTLFMLCILFVDESIYLIFSLYL